MAAAITFHAAAGPQTTPQRAILDRYAARFATEVFPLMERKANGCKACHGPSTPRMFQVFDTAKATFSLVLERDLLNQQDPMFILQRLLTKDPELHMPKAGSWSTAEVERVRGFAADMQRELNAVASAAERSDERFPDSLMLPYDGRPKQDRPVRMLSYYQLRKSMETIFGATWLAASGRDPFENKSQTLGGADFKTTFEISRTPSAGYLSAMQEVAREVSRRFVSASPEQLFAGFDPNIAVARVPASAARNIRTLYNRILFRDPSAVESQQALRLVDAVQKQPAKERVIRLSLTVRDEAEGLEDQATAEITLQSSKAQVSRYMINQAKETPSEKAWVRAGTHPFRFQKDNAQHLIRVVDVPGDHVTLFDAVKLVRVENGKETSDEVIIDNADAECTFLGDWRSVLKKGDAGRGTKAVKKYDAPIFVVGPSHLESRNLRNELRYLTIAPRIQRDGEYNVYLTWPAIPRRAPSMMLEVHSATKSDGPLPAAAALPATPGRILHHLDQTESTLNEAGDDQWQLIAKKAYFSGDGDFVQISNEGVDSTRFLIVADAMKFEPVDGGKPIIVDNGDKDGFETAGEWKAGKPSLAGAGVLYGKDILYYPPSTTGRIDRGLKIDPFAKAWARYRPVREGKYQPGWYKVSIWYVGGVQQADWVPVEVRASKFAPVAAIERMPYFATGETVRVNATASISPGGHPLVYRWTNDAADLGVKLDGSTTSTPSFQAPELRALRQGWAALLEALLQHPGFLMPRTGPTAKPREKLVRASLDLAGRVPTQQEIARIDKANRLAPLVDDYLASPDFKEFFFHRTRAAMMSRGTDETDEPARLWTYIATNDLSYRDLFTADYTVDPKWQRAKRPAECGRTGILTMKSYLKSKPGLPKFVYPAQVLTFSMGVAFELSDAIANARKNIVSTTDPASICYSCHKLLTPLALQRQRWDDKGNFRKADSKGKLIDDTDQNVIPDYPFKGRGLEAFATQLVHKERFVRTFIDNHHDMVFHRRLRILEDERTLYKELYDFTTANDLKIKPLLKRMVLMESGEGAKQ